MHVSGLATDSLRRELENQAERATKQVLDRAAEANINTTANVVEGIPHETILQYVDTHGIDLVVMGTHGRSGINRVLLGSVAERTVRCSPAPVMTVPLPEEGRSIEDEAAAREAARRAIGQEGYEIDALSDVHRKTGSWIVQAMTKTGGRLNVHIDSSTGETRVAELTSD